MAPGGSTGPNWCGAAWAGRDNQVPLISSGHDNFKKSTLIHNEKSLSLGGVGVTKLLWAAPFRESYYPPLSLLVSYKETVKRTLLCRTRCYLWPLPYPLAGFVKLKPCFCLFFSMATHLLTVHRHSKKSSTLTLNQAVQYFSLFVTYNVAQCLRFLIESFW